MSSQGGFDIGDIFNVQNNYLQTLNSQSKEFSTIDGSSQIADYVKNIQDNLQKTSKTYDDANTSSAAVLTEQEKMKEILEDEKDRLEQKEQIIKNAKTMQERKALFADTQRQEYGAYTRIMLIVILALIIHILLRWTSNMLGESKSSGMNTALTLLHILNFAICGIIIIFMYMNLSVRSDINYNHIEMPPPNEDEFENNEQQTNNESLLQSLGICYEETCCGDETRWDSEKGTCISITADISGNNDSEVEMNTDTSSLSNKTGSQQNSTNKQPTSQHQKDSKQTPKPPGDVNSLINQQLQDYNKKLIDMQQFYENPELFELAFAKAWFKLTHRDMGPKACYLGNEVPKEELIWQDPVKKPKYKLKKSDIKTLKSKISKSKLSVSELVSTAWASASTYRGSDKRGGANGARVALEPQISWDVNDPKQINKVIKTLEKIKNKFDNKKKSVSLADLIVLGGNVGIEMAAKKAGVNVDVPFYPGRGDATQEQTDIHSFGLLEPQADGFRNYNKDETSTVSAEEKLIDKAQLMGLTAPEMTVLVGGMRVLDTNFDHSKNGVFTKKPGTLTNDYFVNLLDMNTTWKETDKSEQLFVGKDRKTNKVKWHGTRVDLIFGSNSQLRALAEVYACNDSSKKFVNDFVSAWTKVMNSDRFDLKLN